MSASDDRGVTLEGVGYITAGVPGTGGVIRQRPEDFLVEEIPAYDPCGHGEHIYLMVEKKLLSTSQLLRIIADHFDVPLGAIGYAGMKDKHAVTRQVVSIHAPGRRPEDFPRLRHDQISVLWADLHTNKLRLGHSRGNRFSIRIRATEPTRAIHAHRALTLLARSGVPNFFGIQRFGLRANNHLLGALDLKREHRRLLDELLGPGENPDSLASMRTAAGFYAQGNFGAALDALPKSCIAEREALLALARGASPEKAVAAVHRTQRQFWLSAFQSAIFNRVVARRLEQGLIGELVEGDLAAKHVNGAVFRVTPDDLHGPDLRRRLDAIEISPTGPIWGPKMMRPEGLPGTIEQEEFQSAGVPLESIAALARRIGPKECGTRRPVRVPLRDPVVEGGVDEHGAYIRLAFELPPGAFATIVLREVMKSPQSQVRHDHDGDDLHGDAHEHTPDSTPVPLA